MSSPPTTRSLTVRTITAGEHRAYVASQPAVALQQTPGWGRGFVAARTESIGWFEDERLIGAGLFRYRSLPRLPMRSVAVFEVGPDIDWTGRRRPNLELQAWTDPLIDHLRDRGVFTARINPAIAQREWWGVDPAQRSDSSAVVVHRAPAPRAEASTTTERLRSAGWRSLTNAAGVFTAEVALRDPLPGSDSDRRRSGALLPGYDVRVGTPDDLDTVAAAVAAAHPGIEMPSSRALRQRWEGLASDDLAGVSLIVIDQGDEPAYGGLFAIVGHKAYDLSPPLPQPDADRPEVQILRSQVMQAARRAGAVALTVPTVTPHRRAPVSAPAPGWPPAHLRELIGTWQFAVRSTWHSALAPIVDRLVL
jgi:hypothetical protein